MTTPAPNTGRFRRDPRTEAVITAYLPYATEMIDRALVKHNRQRKNQRISAWQAGTIVSPLWDLARESRATRLNLHERALMRALYRDRRISNQNRKWHPDARWSLKVDWAPAPLLPGQSRGFRLRLFRDTEGARYASKLPKAEKFTENPDLLGSPFGADERAP